MHESFVARVNPPDSPAGEVVWFVFRGHKLLVANGASEARLPRAEFSADLGLTLLRQQYLGYYDLATGPVHTFSAEVAADTSPPSGMEFMGLRALYGDLPDSWFWLAGRAVQIVDWDRTHQYCGRCGAIVENQRFDRAKECPQCGLVTFPRLAPAIIVSVTRLSASGPQILLARGRRHSQGMYSVLAGFVEPGETLEECVVREVGEETGISIDNLAYFGSQPWPFPHSLMVAFTAEYAGGEIVVDEEELEDARWFSPDKLPKVPPRLSIARRLIDSFVAASQFAM